jgi:hypothetical protein
VSVFGFEHLFQNLLGIPWLNNRTDSQNCAVSNISVACQEQTTKQKEEELGDNV